MEQNQILVSIVVPVYNSETYLQACIDSLCEQTHENLEIILVDDGSKDGSGKICDEAARKDSRIRVIHQKNGGVSAARNSGLSESHGDFVSFSDSDDVYSPFFIEILLDQCLKNNAQIAVGDYERFESHISFEFPKQYENEIMPGREGVNRLIGKTHIKYTLVNNKIFRAELFEDIRFLEGKIHEDEDFIYQILYKAGKIADVHTTVYGYRKRPASITTSEYCEARLAVLEIARKRAKFFKESGETDLYANFRWVYAMLLLQHYPRVKKDLKDPKLARKLLQEYRKIVPELLHLPELSSKRKQLTAFFSLIPGQYAGLMELRENSIKNVRK